MKRDLRILMVEDLPVDAALVERELQKGDWSVHFKRVDTQGEFLKELEQQPPDVILSDHGLPSFDGLAALALVQSRCSEVPFIFVTGALGEAMAIQAFESGATDYVLKSKLTRLVPAVHRALRQVEDKRQHQQAELDRDRLIRDLQEVITRLRCPSGLLPICSVCKKIRDDQGRWKAIETYLREHFGTILTHGLCPDCIVSFRAQIAGGAPQGR